jgi:hypothetical protein
MSISHIPLNKGGQRQIGVAIQYIYYRITYGIGRGISKREGYGNLVGLAIDGRNEVMRIYVMNGKGIVDLLCLEPGIKGEICPRN